MTLPATAASSCRLFGRRRPRPTSNESLEPPLTARVAGGHGFVLGRRLRGERVLPCSGSWLVLSPQRLARHVLVMGATGSGKTETALRLAWSVAKGSEASVFYLDGKGDRHAARRFVALMGDARRQARVFPNEPFDGWRGEAHEIQNRLLEVVDYSSEGPAAWYRDVAKAVLHLVCAHPDGPPRSSSEALSRMDLKELQSASDAAGVLTADLVRQVRLRYQAFFAQARGALDGEWAWEDTDAAYLLLDSLALKEEAAGLSRFLFEDFAHYFTLSKPRDRRCVLIVDEFSALAGSSSMAERVEQARGFNTSLVLAPQVTAGMGDPQQAQRILGSVETIVCHRVNTPEEIVALAGTKQAVEYSTHLEAHQATGAGSARLQHQFKISPNDVRGLEPGVAWVISRGKAAKAQMARAPELSAPLPEPAVPEAERSSEKGPAAPARVEVPY